MNTIKYIYIPRIELQFNAKFIADVFNRNNIATVSKIYLEPHKRYGCNKYNKAFIEIESWCETESAYNFLCRLKNPRKEARIVYKDDDWWCVNINRYQHKLELFNKPVLTVFEKVEQRDIDEDLDAHSMVETIDNMPIMVKLDKNKTILLRNIVSNLKEKHMKKESVKEDGEIDELLREVDDVREAWNSEKPQTMVAVF